MHPEEPAGCCQWTWLCLCDLERCKRAYARHRGREAGHPRSEVEGFRLCWSLNTDYGAEYNGGQGFADNTVVSSTYTWYNFLPKFLIFQFSRLANAYFLIVSILQTFKKISITNGIPTSLIPLTFVLLFDAVLTIIEDFRRHREDAEANATPTQVLRGGQWVDVAWKDVQVGDCVRVHRGQVFPADLVLLSARRDDGDKDDVTTCYVKTVQLDGESNLKLRRAPDAAAGKLSTEAQLAAFNGCIECGAPSAEYDEFRGNLLRSGPGSHASPRRAAGPEAATASDLPPVVPLEVRSLLLRGCELHGCHSIVGLAVYTGNDTKLRVKAETKRPVKLPTTESILNTYIIGLVSVQAILCLAGAIGNDVFAETYLEAFYLELSPPSASDFILKAFTFFLLTSSFIPVSLYVSIRLVRKGQAIMMELDPSMASDGGSHGRDAGIDLEDDHRLHASGADPGCLPCCRRSKNTKKESLLGCLAAVAGRNPNGDSGCVVRTMDLVGELGQVTHVFSDKTGTLTANSFEFRKLTVGGVSYGLGTTPIGMARRRRHQQQQPEGHATGPPAAAHTDARRHRPLPTHSPRASPNASSAAASLSGAPAALAGASDSLRRRAASADADRAAAGAAGETLAPWRAAATPGSAASSSGSRSLSSSASSSPPLEDGAERTFSEAEVREAARLLELGQRAPRIIPHVNFLDGPAVRLAGGRSRSSLAEDLGLGGEGLGHRWPGWSQWGVGGAGSPFPPQPTTQHLSPRPTCVAGAGGARSGMPPAAPAGGSDAGGPIATPGTPTRSGVDDAASVGSSASRAGRAGARSAHAARLGHFFLNLALDHSLEVEVHRDQRTGKETGRSVSGSSPDEEAFVGMAALAGWEFRSRMKDIVTLAFRGKECRFRIRTAVEYTAARKMMSVLVEDLDFSQSNAAEDPRWASHGQGRGRFALYAKGADSVILAKLAAAGEASLAAEGAHTRSSTRRVVDEWAADGLRTLAFGWRPLSQAFVAGGGDAGAAAAGGGGGWLAQYAAATEDLRERELKASGKPNRIDELTGQLERQLFLQGATGIEDRLQDDVPATIASLGDAGVRVYMLTGDKQETAVNIGFAVRLLSEEQNLVILTSETLGQFGATAMAGAAVQAVETAFELSRHVMLSGQRPISVSSDRRRLSRALQAGVSSTATFAGHSVPPELSQRLEAAHAAGIRITSAPTTPGQPALPSHVLQVAIPRLHAPSSRAGQQAPAAAPEQLHTVLVDVTQPQALVIDDPVIAAIVDPTKLERVASAHAQALSRPDHVQAAARFSRGGADIELPSRSSPPANDEANPAHKALRGATSHRELGSPVHTAAAAGGGRPRVPSEQLEQHLTLQLLRSSSGYGTNGRPQAEGPGQASGLAGVWERVATACTPAPHPLQSTESQRALARLFDRCDSVIGCRCSPHHKMGIVQLVGNSRPNIRTLAIGDGANDVEMIRASNVGVGIRGKEGSQASTNADIAIGEFRFLERLLLVHGRWNYMRMASLANFMFYKNIMFVVAQFFYSLVLAGSSGQKFYVEYAAQLHNLVYTGLPILVTGWFDQDVDQHSAVHFPHLFDDGRRQKYLNVPLFASWTSTALWEAMMIIVLAYQVGMSGDQTGSSWYVFDLGMIVYTWIIAVLAIRSALLHHHHHWVYGFFLAGCTLCFPITIFIFSAMDADGTLGSAPRVFRSGGLWFGLPIVVAACLLPSVAWRVLRNDLSPPYRRLVVEAEVALRQGMHGLFEPHTRWLSQCLYGDSADPGRWGRCERELRHWPAKAKIQRLLLQLEASGANPAHLAEEKERLWSRRDRSLVERGELTAADASARASSRKGVLNPASAVALAAVEDDLKGPRRRSATTAPAVASLRLRPPVLSADPVLRRSSALERARRSPGLSPASSNRRVSSGTAQARRQSSSSVRSANARSGSR